MLSTLFSSASLQVSGDTGAIVALVVALGIAGIAIIWLTGKKHA